MSHNNEDLLKQVREQYVQGQSSTPLIVLPISEDEQKANAELTREKAKTEKENRRYQIAKRYLIGGIVGFVLGFIAGFIVSRL